MYAGLLICLAGILSLARPLRVLGIRTRRTAAGIVALGLVRRPPQGRSGRFLPSPRAGTARGWMISFPSASSGSSTRSSVHAPAHASFGAVESVTAGEIRFFRLLTWIRAPRLPGERRENILAAPADKPLLEVALHSGFLPLAEDPDREIVFGTIFGGGLPAVGEGGPREFARLDRPGICKVAMNFLLREEPGGWIRLSTETRVFAAGSSADRAFAVYWRLIYPGSAFIRRMWLTAIRRRAEDARKSCLEDLEAVTRPVNKALELFEVGRGGREKRRLRRAASPVGGEARPREAGIRRRRASLPPLETGRARVPEPSHPRVPGIRREPARGIRSPSTVWNP